MLYDPQWQGPDLVFENISLRALTAWLETKRADDEYDFCNPDDCPAAQFLRAQGFRGDRCRVDFGPSWRPVEADRKWLYEIVGKGEPTFGAALKRARLALTEAKLFSHLAVTTKGQCE